MTVAIGPDSVIEPCTQLRGATVVGAHCTIGPHSTLIDATLLERVSVVHSHLVGARLCDGVSVGPFATCAPARCCARVRGPAPSSRSRTQTSARARRSRTSPTSATPTSASRPNLGAGSITANYDGTSKHRTTIGARVHGGVDTSFVAPVSVGDDAWTAAGSVVTSDVPPGALAVARARQRNVERYGERRGK